MRQYGIHLDCRRNLPCGEFLIEDQGELCVVWRISEGEPFDSGLDPQQGWALLAAQPHAAL